MTLPESSFRLERSIVPKHYELTIKSDVENLDFSGKVEIDLDIASSPSSTHKITLHAAPSLKILSAVLSSSSLQSTSAILANEIVYDSKLERVTAVFPNQIVALQEGQKYKLGLRFEGKIGDSMKGYYKSEYEDAQGNKAHYALTQFEATSARCAFPCWDEPDFKATFGLTLLSRKGLTVLANMPVSHITSSVGDIPIFPAEVTAQKNTPSSSSGIDDAEIHVSRGEGNDAGHDVEGDRWLATKFETTSVMSTYLVAYANGDFRHLESSYTSPITGRKVPLRIYTTPEFIDQAEYALEVKSKVLPYYEQLFDIEYPLPKCDTLVVSDLDAGAMENWGLITAATDIYLIDPKNASIGSKKLAATVQSHECAHMWFGNVVTMRWWDNLWLNEAFTTLMGEVISMAALYPEWRPHSSFLNSHLRRALQLDS